MLPSGGAGGSCRGKPTQGKSTSVRIRSPAEAAEARAEAAEARSEGSCRGSPLRGSPLLQPPPRVVLAKPVAPSEGSSGQR